MSAAAAPAGIWRQLLWVAVAIFMAGALVRSLRLAWQPLWWDEGYSIYFATEPLGRMLWLTARDIHPPLYYALLHGWSRLWGQADPVTVRSLSVLLGVAALPLLYWLGRALFPARPRVALVALLLLAVNPMHLFYSQEVRMYGLALALSLASTLCFWRLVARLDRLSPAAALRGWPALCYLLTATAALYTLYYSALLLLAHLLWAAWRWRRRLAALGGLLLVDLFVALAYLPWLLYAVPQLVGYVRGKVQSDQDIPLGPLAYLERHLVAFTAGHVRPPWLAADIGLLLLPTVGICLLILGLVLGRTLRPKAGERPSVAPLPETRSAATGALWTWLLLPVLAGWLINLRYPFFPEGGERLLLLLLPYFLLLLAAGIDRTWHLWHLGKLALAALLAGAVLGVVAFYTTPRYIAHDYRPILRQVVQQGANGDTLLAIFPWQVGYWRAYAPQNDPLVTGPQPLLLAEGAVEWSPAVETTVQAALAAGTLWFPEPLTFGSSLPAEVEGYLAGQAVNLENRWYTATRLTAWRLMSQPELQPVAADFGTIRLANAGIAPHVAASANTPVAVGLGWAQPGDGELNISLRIQDESGHVWSSREYQAGQGMAEGAEPAAVGLIVPVGLPPGRYSMAVSVQDKNGATLTVAGSDDVAAPVGALAVVQPDVPQSPARLPIQTMLARPVVDDGLALIGLTGAGNAEPIMAGSELAVTLFLENDAAAPRERHLYLSLQDAQGAGVAGYEGWPLPAYPTSTWPQGTVAQVPVGFYLPGTLATGNYRLVGGFLDPATGARTPPAELARVAVQQRTASFERPQPQVAFPSPAQFGTHVRLLGYDIAGDADGTATVRLHWEVLQPLLPPHHIFLHADRADGETLAQQDGPPMTATDPAPTGTWQPGEFLTTVHQLRLPEETELTLRAGIYEPHSGVRLPVTIDGQVAGDSVDIK